MGTQVRMGIIFFLCVIISIASGFYLPGVAPRDYQSGDPIELKVNKLDSVKTQLPYDYYSLPFCHPSVVEEAAENLGEILTGDRIENSLYQLHVDQTTYCNILCKTTHHKTDLKHFAEKIEEEYRVNWIVDNIPAATKYFTESLVSDSNAREYVPHYEKGFALGFVGDEGLGSQIAQGVKYVNNHVRLVLFHHSEQSYKGFRIVGFEVEPFSIKHKVKGEWRDHAKNELETCPVEMNTVSQMLSMAPQPVSGLDGDEEIIWTYDVIWEASPIKWASRWDLYLKMTDSQIHWFSIINSITIVLFLSGMVAMIMMRTLHRDLVRYNEIDISEEAIQEETGWKLIHADVFRRPRFGGFFSTLVGTGCQVFAMTLLTLFFAVLGFLSPANRGGLLTALLLLYVFMGTLAGYNATRTYKMFKLTEWRRNTTITSLFLPGIAGIIFFILNLFIWGEESSGAVPFGSMMALLVLWLGISVPLTFLGSYFAMKKPAFEPPVKVNEIPRARSLEQTWYTQPTTAILVGGILPFGAVFIEIFFIMSSVWLHQFYYVFGFLFIVFVILIITCAEISIVMCYFQLCNEDYHWWWRSYLTSGSSALYLFLYSILYFFTRLEIIKFVSGLLFFGYMLLVSLFFFVLTGTIGYFACFHFVRKIYSSIKID